MQADISVMAGPFEHLESSQLWEISDRLEAEQDRAGSIPLVATSKALDHALGGYSTALSDDERLYLDVQAELFRRGEAGRRPCKTPVKPQLSN